MMHQMFLIYLDLLLKYQKKMLMIMMVQLMITLMMLIPLQKLMKLKMLEERNNLIKMTDQMELRILG
jgi:hypothetical protein